MADYSSLQAAIDAGIANMTVIRNNVGQDDGVDTVDAGVDWFFFNSKKVSKIYVSGNSWIGFSSTSTENIKVNRRDAKMYYLYKEDGSIGTVRFIKLRWSGYSGYSSTSSSYAQAYDVFILDNGQIVLLFDTIPTSSFSGTNQFVCGLESIVFTPSTESRNFTFTCSDLQNGTGWSVSEGYPVINANYKSSGNVIFSSTGIRNVANVASSIISWEADIPIDTSLRVYACLDGESYTECTNDSSLPFSLVGSNLSTRTLNIKVEMTTNNPLISPNLKSMNVKIFDNEDSNILTLHFGSGSKNSIQNAVGDITILYSGGTLEGVAGLVQSFEKTFTPTNLTRKTNPNNTEHIGLNNIEGSATLMSIRYRNTKTDDDHIEVSNISINGSLTHVNDI